jgi:hypothetical protein
MQFRRSELARLLPVVALVTIGIAAIAISIDHNPFGVIGFSVLFLLFWSEMAFINWLRRLVIDDESIRLFGYHGRRRVIQKSEVLTCRYRRFRAQNGVTEVAFFLIRDDHGNEIPVWRYGWGPRHRELFSLLGQWLDSSPCTVDDRAREMLAKAV